jgi:hypothetical protein
MIDKEQARQYLDDAVHRALEAGMTLQEVEDEVEYILNNYQDES